MSVDIVARGLAVRALAALPGLASKAGGTFTGNITITPSDLSGGTLLLNGPAGQRKAVSFETAGLLRWRVASGNAAEAGANAGSDFLISRFDDTGALIDSPIAINRKTGVVTISTSLVIAGASFATSADISAALGDAWYRSMGFSL
jgi:hypothetical protein